MPLYEFRCAAGHEHERLANVSVTSIECFCGQRAKRSAVYQHASPRKWASEFDVSRSARAALDEATGYKREALSAMDEAVGNGWKGD